MSLPWPMDAAEFAGRAAIKILGRYFPSGDVRHFKHPLTARILKLKRAFDPGSRDILVPVLKTIDQARHVNIFTRVPPQPNKRTDILGNVLEEACRIAGQTFADRCVLDLLICVKTYPPQKEAGSYNRRRLNVKGAFRSNRPASGHVVLFDDIVTSGSTLAECTRQILAAGADYVTALTLGYNQQVVIAVAPELLECPKCRSPMQVRLNKQNGGVFWGCGRWPNCKNTMVWMKGIATLNERNTREAITIEYDLPF